MAEFPGVIGCVDGTQIRIIAPPSDQEPYYVNRKSYHSINTQVICNSRNKILNVVADWPGSTHDSRILRSCVIGNQFAIGQLRGLLLSDSGYACTNWLLTPLLNPISNSEMRYNHAHTKTRSVVERTFGILKRRFHCLHGELRVKPEKACKIIGACCVLHNIAINAGEQLGNDVNVASEDNDAGNNVPYVGNEEGRTFRAHFIQQHFK